MQLSEFKDEKAFEVAANLLSPITKIVKSDIYQKTTVTNKMELAELLLRADRTAVKEILAILADVAPEDYICTGKTVLHDILSAVSDRDFISLFISPRQNTEEK